MRTGFHYKKWLLVKGMASPKKNWLPLKAMALAFTESNGFR